MKTIKFLAIAFVILSLALTTFADSTAVDSFAIDTTAIDTTIIETISDSVATSTTEMGVVESGFFSNLSLYEIVLFLVGVFEVIVRLYPTAKNYSILSLVNSIINFVFPNKKKEGGTF